MSVLEALIGPGGQYEIVVEDVLGSDLQVYKQRFSSMRDVIAIGDARAELDWLVQGDRRLTFGEHNAQARQAAVALDALGVRNGDRVALLTANTIEWVALFWACAGMGAAAVPLNAWWKAEELDFALRDSGSKVLICDAKRWAIVRDIVETIPTLEYVFVIGLDAPDGMARPASVWDHGTALWEGLHLRAQLERKGLRLPKGLHAKNDSHSTRDEAFALIARQAPRFDTTFLFKANAYPRIKEAGQLQEVPRVRHRVGHHLRREGSTGPVGPLMGLVEMNAKVALE